MSYGTIEGGIWKDADAMTANRGLVEDPVFSGDHAGRPENRGNLGRALSLGPILFFQKSGCVGLWILGVHHAEDVTSGI